MADFELLKRKWKKILKKQLLNSKGKNDTKLQFNIFFPISMCNHSGDKLDFWHIFQDVDTWTTTVIWLYFLNGNLHFWTKLTILSLLEIGPEL